MFHFTFALCEQMWWGDNIFMVDESRPIQGREHIKLVVVMEGDSIDLECQVTFTSKNFSEIRWKLDGKFEAKDDAPINITKNQEVFLEDHLKIDNISRNMAGSTVACEYAKGQYGGSVEAIFRVFQLEIEVSEGTCNTLSGDIKLVFKENNRMIL